MRDWDFSIQSLELTNYRKFKHLHIAFDDYMNVVVGNNGAGKTTLLDACAIATSSLLQKVEDAQSLSIHKSDAHRITVRKGSVAIRQSQYPISIDASGSLNNHPYLWSRGLSSEKSKMTRKDAQGIIRAGEELQRHISLGDNVVLPILAYYDANRFSSKGVAAPLRKSASSFLASRTKAYFDAFDASINERQTLTWMRNMTLWELQSGSKSPELSCVMDVFSSCYANAAETEKATAYFDLQLQDVVVRYEDKKGNVAIETASSMSDGYRSATLMFADIARRMAQLNPQLGSEALLAPGVVLIDGIDLHLHPRWQSHILRDLKTTFPAIQFIVTTHAPIVISSVEANALRILNSNGVACQNAETYGGNIARILKTVMEVDERPKEIRERFESFYEKLDNEDYTEAEQELKNLVSLIGSDDTDIIAAQTALFLEQA